MSKVKVVFKNIGFNCKYRIIECVDWQVNENFYTFWLDKIDNPGSRVISIPVDNVLYIEDIMG